MRWAALATVRYETGPGEQAQVDFGQLHVWIGEQRERVHLFVMTLGYSRRLWVRAYPHERLSALLDGHERAFRHFGGVPLTCLYDNPRTLVLGRRERDVQWHAVFQDFVGDGADLEREGRRVVGGGRSAFSAGARRAAGARGDHGGEKKKRIAADRRDRAAQRHHPPPSAAQAASFAAAGRRRQAACQKAVS